jgi:hypothetical protein
MSFSEGYNEQEIDAPKYVSRGEWELSGNRSTHSNMPMKAQTLLTSGQFGVSGTYQVHNWALPYDDNSGISGCIGINLRTVKSISDTGIGYSTNQNLGLRNLLIMHEGYVPMYYQSGTLDGVPKLMKYGDRIAPCVSGFRTYEDVNLIEVSAIPLGTGLVVSTGIQQCNLGWWADITSNLTGVRHRVKVMANHIYGHRPA